MGLWDLLGLQLIDVKAMFGLALVAVAGAGLVVALRDHRYRGLAGATLLVTLPYPLMFPVGAVVHDYWNYWFLLPISVGIAVACDLVLGAMSVRPLVERAAPVVVGLIAVAFTVAMSLNPPPIKQAILDGTDAGVAVVDAPLPADQRQVWVVGPVGSPPDWLTLATGRPATVLKTTELAGLAQSRPHEMVFVSRPDCFGKRSYALEAAEEVAADPPVVPRPCSAR